jgi:hypothetical protein
MQLALVSEKYDEDRFFSEAMEYKYFSLYCGSNHREMNEALRFNKGIYRLDIYYYMQKVLDYRLESSTIHENIWTYRLLNYKDFCRGCKKKCIKTGTVIEDRAYMGTGLVLSGLSKQFEGSYYDTILKIKVSKGAKGLYLDMISRRENEQEVLFARDSKIKVVFTYVWKRKHVIICKMLV